MQTSEAYTKIKSYIDHNPAAVVGTINADGTPYGSAVYVCALSGQRVCFVTKNLTQKYVNISETPQVSLTFFNEKDSSTLQASGTAAILNDAQLINMVMDRMTRIHAIRAEWLPPISKLRAGNYVTICVTLTKARLAEYQGLDIGSEQIFTEL
jgi:general stress protein 26